MERVSKLVNNIYAQNGSMILNDGEIMVSGEIPQTIPTQYCYELFRPLTAEDIQRVADSYRNPFPQALKDFYQLTNGAFLFGRCISIFGVPKWEAQYKQPMALAFADGHRTKGCPRYRLFFACYNCEPEVQVFFDTREQEGTMHVYAAKHGSNDIIAEWPSFAELLISEHAKYSEKFNNGDYKIVDVVKGMLAEVEFSVTL